MLFRSHFDASPDDYFCNVGTGTDLSIRELAARIAEVVGFQGSITWNSAMPDGTPRKLLDVSRLSALGWKPGQREVSWDRQVVAVAANGLTLDAPLTTALDKKYGGGTVARCTWPGLISQVGVENLHLESTTDAANPKDENHRWVAIDLENAQDAWVRQVAFRHFAGSAVLAPAGRPRRRQPCRSRRERPRA